MKRFKVIFAGFAGGLLLWPSPRAFALPLDNQTLLSSSLRMTWGLLVVVAILLIVYWLAKKRLASLHGSSKGIIKVIESRHLMPKKSLYLVEVRGREFLLGAGSESIELIAAIDGSPHPPTFADLLETSETG